MNNIKKVMVTKDKLVKELAFLKVKKYLSAINDGEFVESLLDLYNDEYYCGVVEKLSQVTFGQIIKRIEYMKENYSGFKILFNESVPIVVNDYCDERLCDLILLSKEGVEVIKVFTRETDIINSYEASEMRILGVGVINKFLTQSECEEINLTIIQPNLLITTICKMEVEDLLHQWEYGM